MTAKTMIDAFRRNRVPMALAVLILVMMALAPMTAHAEEMRCGWLDNPSPGNASLYDKDGEWTIGIQGDHQAKGDWPPDFPAGQWISHGPDGYGYGCACLTVDVDAEAMNILAILSGKARPLSACRADPAVRDIEKQLQP